MRRTDCIRGAVAGYLGEVDVGFADGALVVFVRGEVFCDDDFFNVGEEFASIFSGLEFAIYEDVHCGRQPTINLRLAEKMNHLAVLMEESWRAAVRRSSSCEKTGIFLYSEYRCTHNRPYSSQSLGAKLTASFILN